MGTFHLALGGRLLPQEHPPCPSAPTLLGASHPLTGLQVPGEAPCSPGSGGPCGAVNVHGGLCSPGKRWAWTSSSPARCRRT